MGATITTIEIETPRIYVACLAAYNNGILHGAWIDATGGAWTMWEGVRAMLASSPIEDAEEYAIHDYEGFEEVRIAEYTGIARVAEIAGFIVEHGALGAALLDHFGGAMDDAREAMEDRYHGCYASLADYVQEVTWETVAIPESLQYYIDWPAMARDAEMSGDLFTIETGYEQVHVFSGG